MTFETLATSAIAPSKRTAAPPVQSRRTTMTSAQKGTALVTGASSGIGAIYAHRLAHRGYDLILVARNADRLSALATRLTKETGRTVETIAADLNDKSDLARIETVLKTH